MSGDITLVPWYDREDFSRFASIDGDAMPSTYEAWLHNAMGEVERMLARGDAVQIIRLRAQQYFEWLDERRYEDTPERRVTFLRQVCYAALSVPRPAQVGCVAEATTRH